MLVCTMYYRIQPCSLLSAYELHSALRKIDIEWAALQYIPQQVKSSVEEESVRHKILRIVNSHKNDVGGILKNSNYLDFLWNLLAISLVDI